MKRLGRFGGSSFRAVVMVATVTMLVLANDPTPSAVTPDAALGRLIAGNERYVSGKLRLKHFGKERAETAKGQHPYAIVLACADSRVPPEILFDESIGRLFVVRVAGNVVDPVLLGSIEYAVEHLHVNLLFVLGHENCGAVKATIEGGKVPPNIAALVKRIAPAVEKIRAKKIEESKVLGAAVRENVLYQMQMAIEESEVLKEAVHESKLKIAGGVYGLQSGRVEIVAVEAPKNESNHDAKPASRPRRTSAAKDEQTEEATENRDASRQTEPAATPAAAQPEKATGAASTQAPTEEAPTFRERIQRAYKGDSIVLLRKSMLMRDNRDRCLTDDCRSIPAGETIRFELPVVFEILGRPQLKVRYKKKTCYIIADEKAFLFLDV